MKRYLFILAATFCFAAALSQNYKVTLQTSQYKSGIAYLTYHMGKSLNAEDSAVVSNKGIAIFTGKRHLPGGIYSIVFPGRNRTLDFFIDKEQVINIKADTTDLLNKTIVTGSKENVLFVQYQKYIASKGDLLENERKAYNQSKTKADSISDADKLVVR